MGSIEFERSITGVATCVSVKRRYAEVAIDFGGQWRVGKSQPYDAASLATR